MYMCAWRVPYPSVYMHEGQKSMLVGFLYHSPAYILRQDLSLNLELVILARLAG